MNKVVLVFALLLLNGCGYMQYRIHDYDTVMVPLAAGTLYVETLTTSHKISEKPSVTEFGEPFSFRIFFITEDAPGQAIDIKAVNLEALGAGAEIMSAFDNMTRQDVFSIARPARSATGYISLIRAVTTEGKPVALILEVIYRGESETVTVNLVPRYTEEMRGGIGDLIRSV